MGIVTLAYENIGILDRDFPHSTLWTIFFYGVLVAMTLIGWSSSGKKSVR